MAHQLTLEVSFYMNKPNFSISELIKLQAGGNKARKLAEVSQQELEDARSGKDVSQSPDPKCGYCGACADCGWGLK